jgi:hypothetical protein
VVTPYSVWEPSVRKDSVLLFLPLSFALALAGLVLLRALIIRVLILALSVIAPRLICVAFLVLILPPALALGSYLVHFYAVDHDESSLCRPRTVVQRPCRRPQ